MSNRLRIATSIEVLVVGSLRPDDDGVSCGLGGSGPPGQQAS